MSNKFFFCDMQDERICINLCKVRNMMIRKNGELYSLVFMYDGTSGTSLRNTKEVLETVMENLHTFLAGPKTSFKIKLPLVQNLEPVAKVSKKRKQ